jgi:hypothetical protein
MPSSEISCLCRKNPSTRGADKSENPTKTEVVHQVVVSFGITFEMTAMLAKKVKQTRPMISVLGG